MGSLSSIQQIRRLREQSNNLSSFEADHGRADIWSRRVISGIAEILGDSHCLSKRVREISDAFFDFNHGNAGYLDEFYLSGVRDIRDALDAAIKEVDANLGVAVLDGLSFDPELWNYVKRTVAQEEWEKVPSDVVRFVEDKVRRLSGADGSLVGKGLFAKVMGDDGDLRLGSQKSEYEGWRGLGMGLAQAVGNVNRHHVKDREDEKKYALGVLGLGSLILTQIRYEYPDKLPA